MSRKIRPDETESESESVEYDDWREHLEEGVLLGLECRSCGHVTATPKRACVECGDRELATVELSLSGKIYSETTINVTPEEFEGPYQVAVVNLGKARLLARIDGEVDIDEKVTFVGTNEAEDRPAPVFRVSD